MTRQVRRTVLLGVAGVLVALLVFVAILNRPGRAAAPSATIVWAWERPEDLRDLDPATAGVAFLARTVTLDGDRVLTRPRLQPLRVPDGASLVAVVRIEDGPHPPTLSDRQRQLAAARVVGAAHPRASALQIDFDATVSERPFYRELLMEVRADLPQHVRLTITALASWCLDDRWLEGLPIDEAVPMLFRMGPDADRVRRRLNDGVDFTSPVCRQSVGISTDEPWPLVRADRRRYVFSPRAWSPAALRDVISEIQR